MAVLSVIAGGRPAATLAGTLALTALVTSAVWRGQDMARGARLGLVAGLPPLLLPVIVEATGTRRGCDRLGHQRGRRTGLARRERPYQMPEVRYSWIERAALRPAPMARMTVAAPVTMSPPAKTPFFDVRRVSGSATAM